MAHSHARARWAEYPGRGVYREIVKPERFVFTSDATDKDGKVIVAGLTTVTFAEEGGKTKLTLRVRATAMVDYAVACLAEWKRAGRRAWTAWPKNWREAERLRVAA